MTRNVKTVLLVSVLFGASTGIYEFVLPYYLKERGISPQAMGWIFAVAAAVIGLLTALVAAGAISSLAFSSYQDPGPTARRTDGPDPR